MQALLTFLAEAFSGLALLSLHTLPNLFVHCNRYVTCVSKEIILVNYPDHIDGTVY